MLRYRHRYTFDKRFNLAVDVTDEVKLHHGANKGLSVGDCTRINVWYYTDRTGWAIGKYNRSVLKKTMKYPQF